MAFDRDKFVWRELVLFWAGKPVLSLKPDSEYSHLYRIEYPNGWTSPPANLTRARDAAYGHARVLLGGQTPVGAPHSPETASQVGG